MTSLGTDPAPCAADEFLELICADAQLLQAEFDALISAEFPAASPPTSPPPAARAGGADQPRGLSASGGA
jgi:hypothetical protein